MKRYLIFLPTIIGIIALSVISVSIAFADTNDKDNSSVNKFASKVASILGLSETDVSNAMSQAKEELILESIESKLSDMVSNGLITQDEADKKLNDIDSDFLEKGVNGHPKKGLRGKGWGHKKQWDKGLKDSKEYDLEMKRKHEFYDVAEDSQLKESYIKIRESKIEEMKARIDAAVAAGAITQQQADQRLNRIK